jgi:hypothetical protein
MTERGLFHLIIIIKKKKTEFLFIGYVLGGDHCRFGLVFIKKI